MYSAVGNKIMIVIYLLLFNSRLEFLLATDSYSTLNSALKLLQQDSLAFALLYDSRLRPVPDEYEY